MQVCQKSSVHGSGFGQAEIYLNLAGSLRFLFLSIFVVATGFVFCPQPSLAEVSHERGSSLKVASLSSWTNVGLDEVLGMLSIKDAQAQTAESQALEAQQNEIRHKDAQRGFFAQTIFYIALGLVVLYLFFVKPAKVEQEAQKKFIGELKKNDSVTTSGGILGRVVSVKESVVTLEIAPNVRIRVSSANVRPMTPSPVGQPQGSQKSEAS